MSTDQSICLCMIVKNEAAVIRRCLDSVRSIITHWVIVDTGSTDGTQDIIRSHLKDLPGTLHERPWKDFAHNRSEALALARPHAQYSLIIDADDALELGEGYQLPRLDADCYMLEIRDDPLIYWRIQLVNNRLFWQYRGVLHEFVASDAPHSTDLLSIGMRRNHDGARRKDPSWFEKDIRILEDALAVEGDPFLRSRYTFYLAQSYRDSQRPAEAIHHYLARSKLGFWREEVFVSLYQAGRLMEQAGYPDEDVLRTYQSATDANPDRIEARHAASRLCRIRGMNARGYEFAKPGLGKRLPADSLFAESWIYDYGLADEFSVNAYWAGQFDDAISTGLSLLQEGKHPSHEHGRILGNLKSAWESRKQTSKPPSLGSRATPDFISQHSEAILPRSLAKPSSGAPRVLLAILAKQKEKFLPLYLQCIENLNYPKSSIVLYVRTNNNRNETATLLQTWIDRVGHLYAGVDFDGNDVDVSVERYGAHEWNPERFAVLGKIRQESLLRTIERACDYYFVCDVDNFIRPDTLRELVSLGLPIVAPFLRSIEPRKYYSNYHAEIDVEGYYVDADPYYWIANRWVRGIVEVPVVHCTYLVRADVIGSLCYVDGTNRHEYAIFSHSARIARISQYIDNRKIYGYIAFDHGDAAALDRDIAVASSLVLH